MTSHHRSRPLAANLQTETDLRKAILEAVRRHPAVFWAHENNQDVRQRRNYGLGDGSPDIVGTLKGGRAFWLEVKKTNGNATMVQLEWNREHRANGELCEFVDSPQVAIEVITNREHRANGELCEFVDIRRLDCQK
jgi:hypothetical protein